MTSTLDPPTTGKHFARNSEAGISMVPIGMVAPWDGQPRKHFDQAALEELAASIAEHGLLEPLVVRNNIHRGALPSDPDFLIVAGERRYRAATLAGLERVPVRMLGYVDDAKALELALVENLHREDLDPIEEAEGYAALNRVAGMKQTEIAAAVRRSQPAIANAMRLLELPEDVQKKIQAGQLTPAHGRALVKYAKWPKLCNAIAEQARDNGLTTKQLETGFGYGAIPSYDLERKGLLATVQTDVPTAELQKVGVTVFKQEIYAGGLTPDVALFKTEAARIRKEQGEAQKEAQAKVEAALKGPAGVGELIRLEDLNYDQYRSLEHTDAPAGCGSDCPCRMRAISRYDEQEVEICADPKRFDELRKADERRANEAKREQMRGYLEQAEIELAAVEITSRSGTSRRALALLAFYVLCESDKPRRAAAWKQFSGSDEKLPDDLGWNRWDPHLRTLQFLETIPPASLVRVAASSVVRTELHQRFEGFSSQTHVTRWLTGVMVPDRDGGSAAMPSGAADDELDWDPDIARARLTATLIDWEVLDHDQAVTDRELVALGERLIDREEVDGETAAELEVWTSVLEGAASMANTAAEAAE